MEALTLLPWFFDSLTSLGLLLLAWRMLASPQLFSAIVMFVLFGLLTALAWVRLDAPDVALAEVAIGAGLTGALLLAALAKLRAMGADQREVELLGNRKLSVRILHWMPVVLLSMVAIGLGQVVLSLPSESPGLSAEVAANIGASGVDNPVVAVLLNFRSYDTLLEMVILFLAVVAVWSLGSLPPQQVAPPGTVLDTLTRILTPVLILLATYILWVGARGPGGAFQAGAILGAAGVLLVLTGWQPHPRLMALPFRLALAIGPMLFLVAALGTIISGRRLLDLPQEWSGSMILFLEVAATFSIGATLAALFKGECPHEMDGE